MNSDPSIQEETHSYPLMSGWPYMTSAMPGQRFGPQAAGTIIPRIDILETESSVVYVCDLAGADGNQLNLEISSQEIAINAPLTNTAGKHPGARYIYQERPAGTYNRLLAPPVNVDLDEVKADLNNGLLEINFPKLNQNHK